MASSWGTSWLTSWASSWGTTTTGGQSRSKRQWTREELDKYKTKEPELKVVAVKEPKVVKEVYEIVSKVIDKPLKIVTAKEKHQAEHARIRDSLLKYLEEEGKQWKREYDKLIALEYKLVLKQQKEDAELQAKKEAEVKRVALIKQQVKLKQIEDERKELERKRKELLRQQEEEEQAILMLLLEM